MQPDGGLFAQWQPRYAEHGIATFPVGQDKRPGVRGYLRIGLPASRQLALKFTMADAFGLVLGARNKLTVLDVDTPDESVLADSLAKHGKTPFIVRSGSGNWQAWYAHSGETRKIRPDPRVPVDILGAGFVVAPPSVGAKGSYEFVAGSLDDLERLPPMRMVKPEHRPSIAIPNGTRNDTLFRRALMHARGCDDLDALVDAVRTENLMCDTPLDDTEVIGIAKSAWGIETRGTNFLGVGGTVCMHNEIDDLAASDPDALALLLILRRHHAQRDQFILANEMHKTLGWRRQRFTEARNRLEKDYSKIECLHRGGRGRKDPPVYRLKVSDSAQQYKYTPSFSPLSPAEH